MVLPKDTKISSNVSKIGFFLESSDEKIINNISKIIEKLVKEYKVFILPLNMKDEQVKIVKKQLKKYEYDNSCTQTLFYVNDDVFGKGSNLLEFANNVDVIIAFQSLTVNLSILSNKPFICISTSSQLSRIKANLNNDFLVEPNLVFVKGIYDDLFLNIDEFENRFGNSLGYINNNYIEIQSFLKCYKKIQIESIQNNVINIPNDKRKSPPQYISNDERLQLIKTIINNIVLILNVKKVKSCIQMIYKGSSLNKLKFQNKNNIKYSIIEELLWIITGDPHAPYYYGLLDNILTLPLLPQIEWIIDDYYMNYKYKNNEGQGTLAEPKLAFGKGTPTIINKNFQELHRSGWQYIIDNLVLELDLDNITIDTYIDKTFHWNSKFYKSKNIIPYIKPWVGFIHHTFSDYNNKYNCKELFDNKLFQDSLGSCKCLIVMSEYLKQQILLIRNDIRIEVIYHPTEITHEKFAWDKFISNDNRSVIQIGNWLRNVFAIYNLELPLNSIIKHKSVLKNKNTENYFVPSGFFDEFKKLDGQSNVVDMCKISFTNMHLKGMYNTILDYHQSVNEIEYLENNDYDKLLSQNIVFINLVDASAINTLLECIMRNTPIIINPIDAVVEILGKDYPLYYTTMYEASCLLDDESKLQSGHLYLLQIDKSKFYIDTFIEKFSNLLKEIDL
jgi:hypothetical protein